MTTDKLQNLIANFKMKRNPIVMNLLLEILKDHIHNNKKEKSKIQIKMILKKNKKKEYRMKTLKLLKNVLNFNRRSLKIKDSLAFQNKIIKIVIKLCLIYKEFNLKIKPCVVKIEIGVSQKGNYKEPRLEIIKIIINNKMGFNNINYNNNNNNVQ